MALGSISPLLNTYKENTALKITLGMEKFGHSLCKAEFRRKTREYLPGTDVLKGEWKVPIIPVPSGAGGSRSRKTALFGLKTGIL